jgi:hypothetical protein
MWKKLIFIVLAATLTLMPTTKAIAGDWFNASLSQVASNGSVGWVVVTATDGKFTGSKVFYVTSGVNLIMATLLTALSLNKHVAFYSDDINAPGATVTCASLLSE